LLPDCRLHLIGACGHWTMIERAAEFLGVVEPFLVAS
jgi:pimeloyl-ACP methyl ester carboxylesterase